MHVNYTSYWKNGFFFWKWNFYVQIKGLVRGKKNFWLSMFISDKETQAKSLQLGYFKIFKEKIVSVLFCFIFDSLDIEERKIIISSTALN